MKKLLFALCVVLLVGCAGFQLNSNPDVTAVLASSVAIEIGCSVQKHGDMELDRSLRNLYTYAKTGTIPQDALIQVNQQLSKLTDRPTLGAQITNLGQLLGASYDTNLKQFVGIGAIPEKVLEATANGYNLGFGSCKGE